VAVLALVAFVFAGTASAGGPGRWDKITTAQQSNAAQIGVLRTGDGTLHVAWQRDAGTTDELLHTPIAAGGSVGSSNPIVTGWNSVGDAVLVSDPAGMRVFFNGIRTVNVSEPLFGLNTATAPAPGSPWSLGPASVATADFAYGRTPAAVVAGDGTPFQAWYSVGQTVVHRGLSAGTPDFPYGSDACCSIRQNLAVDATSGRMFVGWCSFDQAPNGVWLQEVGVGSGAPAGPALQLPGSTSANAGAQVSTCNLDAVTARTPFVARPGGGLYVAGSQGYPSQTRVLVWRLGSDGMVQQTIQAGGGAGVRSIALAAAPDGRIWVGWTTTGSGVVHVRRSNAAGTGFGLVVDVPPPAGGIQGAFSLDLAAQRDRADVLARFGTASSVDVWHRQVLAPPDPIPAPPVIAPTAPKPFPPKPPKPPSRYGVLARAYMTKLRGGPPVTRVPRAPGFRAHFRFRSKPALGAVLKATWFYNRLVGEFPEPVSGHVTSFLKSRGGMPRGYFRCVLQARLSDGRWRPVNDARVKARVA
jgi:hypothetical protein